ncbi:conserved hypothetical protein [Tenacibaculum litopenaei]|uniref:hypothetical protein n=1 Tax=Tenacibaculum litopenaei TaxID=396016 RepID=UPI0038936ED7
MNFQKNKKWFLIGLLAITLNSFGIYQYLFQAPKTTEQRSVAYRGTTNDFLTKLQKEPTSWNGKTVVLTGVVTELLADGVLVDAVAFCQMTEKNSLSKAQKINIKGQVIGYDELLNELKLHQCILEK